MEDIFWAVIGPALLLLVIVLGYLATVFEPYWAVTTKEGIELLRYHAKDEKLRLIAEYWAAQLRNHKDGYYDDQDADAVRFSKQLHYLLVHHRFIFGDDPQHMRLGGRQSHRLLRTAMRLCNIDAEAEADKRPQVIGLVIKPNLVKTLDERDIWRGRPQEYKSRFNDMYYEP